MKIQPSIFTQQATHPALPWLKNEFPKQSSPRQQLEKINKPLTDYAIASGYAPEKLPLAMLFTGTGEISPDLLAFISRSARKAKYKGQLLSRLKSLSRYLADLAPETTLAPAVPDFLAPVLAHLPRLIGKNGLKLSAEKRLELPLTANGREIFAVLCAVSAEIPCHSLSELFAWRAAVKQSIRKHTSANKVSPLSKALNDFFGACGFHPEKQLRISRLPEEWPATFRKEWELFCQRATSGVESEEIKQDALTNGYAIGRLSELTISGYQKALGLAFGNLAPATDLGVLDLLHLTKPKRDQGARKAVGAPKPSNALVDRFREVERAKINVKRAGSDSVAFAHFTLGLKAMASRLGHGQYVKPFNEAYRIRLDQESKEARKARKKSAFSIVWIDQEIARLFPRFENIVKKKSYLEENLAGHRDLQLVLFFVNFVTLRYMGYRQQNLVQAKYKSEVNFEPKGPIRLEFAATMLKNNKAIAMTLKAGHVSHAMLYKTLHLYHQVYQVLAAKFGPSLEGKFFFTQSRGRVRPFKDARDFDSCFCDARDKFLRLDEIAPADRFTLNPHFLRGLCVDWLLNTLRMSLDRASVYIGDDARTLEKEYMDKGRVYDASGPLDEANEQIEARERLHNKADATELARRDKQIASLQKDIKRLLKTIEKQTQPRENSAAA